nr:uncharacterized protein LOC111843860 [Paramormyrops kingsleyae]
MEGEVVLWSVVQFPNGGTAVVLESWLNTKEKTLLWPPPNIKLSKALRDRMKPDDKWIFYEDVRSLITCETFEEAKRRESKYNSTMCATSELESEDEGEMRKKRRSRPNPLFLPSDSDELSGVVRRKTRFAKPPDVAFPEMPNSSQSHAGYSLQHARNDSSNGSYLDDLQSAVPSMNSPVQGSSGQYTPLHPLRQAGNNYYRYDKPFDQGCTDVNTWMQGQDTRHLLKDLGIQKITSMLAEVLVVVKEASRDIQFLKSELADVKMTTGGLRGPVTTLEMLPIKLPILNEGDFNEAESLMNNESIRQRMIAHLALVGGTTSDSMIRRMLATALSNPLACHLNWAGKGNKQPFKQTIMQDCMFGESRPL